MVKTHNRIIAGVLSVLFTGQIALFGDGTSKGILHPDTIAYAAESIKEKKTEKELAEEFEQAVSELGQVDYFGDTDVVTGSRLLKSARARSANSDPMDDVSSSLTVSGKVTLGEVSGVTRSDDPPIYVRIYTGDWQELTHQTVHNGESYNVSIEGGYSDVYHVKYECDGYLPFYLKDYGTGSFVIGSNGSHDTVTLVPGDTTYNANDNNQWSDDNLTSDDANYVSSCLHAVKGASDYLDWMDMDGDGTISQSDVNEIQAMYINMDEDSISVPSNISAYDLNNDNVINTNDFTDFANYLDHVITTLPGVWDINGDGSINADDYTAYTYVKDTLVYIEANGEIIETTKEHPFWVEGQGWTKAKLLNTGDELRDADGNNITIDNVDIVPLPENQYTIVYNLEVADYHTYYVTNSNILVHNMCPPEELIDGIPNNPGSGRRFMSKSEYKKFKKEGFKYNKTDSRGGISMTSTKVKPQHPELIKKSTGALGADFYVDINTAGKNVRFKGKTKGGLPDWKIMDDVLPSDIIDHGKVKP